MSDERSTTARPEGSALEEPGSTSRDTPASTLWKVLDRQTLAELLVSLGLGGLIGFVLPWPEADPFRGSMALVPLVLASFRGLLRQGRTLTASDGGQGLASTLVLLVLLVLTVGRHRLGLVQLDTVLAMAWVALLALGVTRVLLALRPRLGHRLPKRPSFAFLLLPLVTYLALLPWMAGHRAPDGDEPYYLLLTHSLAYDLDTELSNNYADDAEQAAGRPLEPQPGDPQGPDGEIRSRHNALLPLFLVPVYWLAGRWGAMAVLTACAATVAWMMLRLAYHYAPRRPGPALMAYAVLAFGSPLLVYSYQVWVEVPAALLFTLALDRLLVLRRRDWTWGQALGFLLPVALLPMLKLRFVLLAGPLLLLAARRTRPSRRILTGLGVALLGVLAAVAVYNWWRFGHPLKMHRWSDLVRLASSPAAFARGGSGLLFDTAFGLFGAAPVWWLLLPGVWLAVRKRWALVGDTLLLAGPYCLLLAPRVEWFGGWAPAFRYPLVLLPLLALFLMPAFAERRRPGLGLVVPVLVLLTVVAMATWITIPGWTYNFADGRTLWLDSASSRLGVDVARFFPSMVRPRLATWLWPLGSLLLVPLVVWGRPRKLPSARLAGSVLVGAGLVALLAIVRAPTRVIEPEDPWVRTDGGGVFPPMWTVQRVAYRCGWRVHGGGSFRAPVVAGGAAVTLQLEVRMAQGESSHPLRILAGDTLLAQREVRGREWQRLEVGPLAWPAGQPPLVIAGREGVKDWRGGVVVDQIELDWHREASAAVAESVSP